MKRTYFSFFALLLVAFMLFAGLSFFKDGIEESFGINTATFASDLLSAPDDELELADMVTTDSASGKATTTVERAPLDTTKKNILFIGDSMLERLSPRIAAYAEENGHQMNTVIWYGSSTEVWATSGRAKECIRKYRPDYIIISLGGNELFITDIIARRTKYVKQIVAEFADIPYVWIGPPNWKKDTGINKMIQSVVPKGNFYLSYTPDQHYERAKDGAHPTPASAAKWADRICKWIVEESNNPIVLNLPQKARAYCHTETFSMTDNEVKAKPKAEPTKKKAVKPATAPEPATPVAAQPEMPNPNTETL